MPGTVLDTGDITMSQTHKYLCLYVSFSQLTGSAGSFLGASKERTTLHNELCVYWDVGLEDLKE